MVATQERRVGAGGVCESSARSTATQLLLSDRELRGEIDHALARDPALEAWVLVATREVGENVEQSLAEKGESVGVPVVILDWKPGVVSALAALCSTAPDLVENIFSKTAGALAWISTEQN